MTSSDDIGWGELQHLQQENEELRTALEFYADPSHWRMTTESGEILEAMALKDSGALARKVLGLKDAED